MKINFTNYWKLNRNSFEGDESLRSNRIFKMFGIEWWEEGWADWLIKTNYLEIFLFNFSIKCMWEGIHVPLKRGKGRLNYAKRKT